MKNSLLLSALIWIVALGSAVAQEAQYSDTISTSHYTLSLEVMNFDAGILYGTAEVDVTSKMDGITAIPLQLLEMNIDEILVNGTAIPDWDYNMELLRIPLTTALNSGDGVTLAISYHGEPVIEPYNWGGFHFTSTMAYNLGVAFDAIPHCYGRSWYPCVDDFVDRATYEFYITTEEDMKAVCNGILEEETNNGNGTITWHWTFDQTIPSYLVAVSVADYELIEMDYSGINGPLPLEIYMPENYVASATELYSSLPEVMAIYENLWGAYPFDRVRFTGTGKGAMEHASNISMPLGSSSPTLGNEILFSHELSHMWFGDKVTCSRAEDMWLNEGWATYNEELVQEFLYSPEQALQYYIDTHNNVVFKCHRTDGGWYALNNIPQDVTYGMTAYKKGGCVAHTLRYYLGDDVFFPAIQNYLNEYAYQPASSEDMMNSITNFTSIDMQPFFEGWVFSPGFPGFEIDSLVTTPAGTAYETQIFIQQKLDHNTGLVDMNRLPVTLFSADFSESQTTIVAFSGEFGTETVSTPFTPAFGVIDYEEHLSDAMTNFETVVETPGLINFPNTWCKIDFTEVEANTKIRTEHYYIAPDPLFTPIEGLRLSDYRYWRITGALPEGSVMNARFSYNQSTLDETLLTNTGDSIVLLYRPDPAHNWSAIPFDRIGPFQIGELYTTNSQLGEYCLAVWEEDFVGIETTDSKTVDSIHIFPNPAEEEIQIELTNSVNGELIIYDMQGKSVAKIDTRKGKSTYKMRLHSSPAGSYIITLNNRSNQRVAQGRFILK